MQYLKIAALAALGLAGTAASAQITPPVMVQPDDAVIIAGGPGNGAIENTYDQSGLSVGYVSGETPVDPYLSIASHTNTFAGFEWFGNSGDTSATVSYHVTLPAHVLWIDSFELWNEESSGIGLFDLWWGTSAGDFTTLLLDDISPPDNPLGPDYFANLYPIAPTRGGWYTLVMSECPQPDPGSFASCAIGEVAFNGPVPEPETWALMLSGFGLVGWAMRRKGVAMVSA